MEHDQFCNCEDCTYARGGEVCSSCGCVVGRGCPCSDVEPTERRGYVEPMERTYKLDGYHHPVSAREIWDTFVKGQTAREFMSYTPDMTFRQAVTQFVQDEEIGGADQATIIAAMVYYLTVNY